MRLSTHRPLTRGGWPPGLGAGWIELVEELEAELQELDPRCFIWAIDVQAPPRVSVEAPAEAGDEARALVADVAERSLQTCESCGGPAGVRAGPVVTVNCYDCVP